MTNPNNSENRRERPVAETTRRQMEDFFSDYVHCLDDGTLEAWPGFFASDGVYQIISRESHDAGLPIGIMHCSGRGMMEDRIHALRRANIFEPHVYCHMLSAMRIYPEQDGSYRVRTNVQVLRTMQDGGTTSFATGKYLDQVIIENDRCQFRERRVILDSKRIDILLVIPL